jgi:hypothetical protein
MTTALNTPHGVSFFRICALKGALKLRMAGLRVRMLPGRADLDMASEYTRKQYKNGRRAEAVADLEWIIEGILAAKER